MKQQNVKIIPAKIKWNVKRHRFARIYYCKLCMNSIVSLHRALKSIGQSKTEKKTKIAKRREKINRPLCAWHLHNSKLKFSVQMQTQKNSTHKI